tara:strand:- start:1455 stop:1589 length:135 start_codon:yes stop_codon:yes gene_type:complete
MNEWTKIKAKHDRNEQGMQRENLLRSKQESNYKFKHFLHTLYSG